MARLCERPGCSEPGAAAYGMVPEDLVFWIEALPDASSGDPSVLCRRHADAMVVPRGWTLDDRREDTLRLFKPRPAQSSSPVPTSRPRRRRGGSGEQLIIDGTGEIQRPARTSVSGGDDRVHLDDDPQPHDVVHDDERQLVDDGDSDRGRDGVGDPGCSETDAGGPTRPWRPPTLDHDDDLDGLLEVSSPLLTRAFRSAGRRQV